jgi:hypothetical protein
VAPAVVEARRARVLDIHLLPAVLSDVGDVHAPWSNAKRTDSAGRAPRSRAALPAVGKRIVGRDAVRVTAIDVDPQHLAEQLVRILRAVAGSPPDPPSPMPIHSFPSGPNITSPPL